MQITRGIVKRAQKVVVYGPEGIGKSTFLSNFPSIIFSDTEGSTMHMDVDRTPKPSSWTMLLNQVGYFIKNPHLLNTFAIDTADWAEKLCITEVCSKANKDGIEGFGYGKGVVYVSEEYGKLLNLLEELIEAGVNVVIAAHAQTRKFDQPDEMGAYDRWELKLTKYVSSMVREWADMVLFVNYETIVIKTEDKKNKGQGGKRVMHTCHHPCWDAKNRHDLKEKLDFKFTEIAHCIPIKQKQQNIEITPPPKEEIKSEPTKKEPEINNLSNIPKPLLDLMNENKVTPAEIQQVVSDKGYYPKNTPIENYDEKFISGVLVSAWTQVLQMIIAVRELPFK